MSAENNKTLTVNRPHKATWETFIPESFDINLVQSLVSLKTFWGTYLGALADGSVNAVAKQKSEQTKW